jgi:putative glutamine amidotransferase
LDTTPPDDAAAGFIAIPGQGVAGAARIPTLYIRAIEKAGGRAEVFCPFDQLRTDENVPEDVTIHMDVDLDDVSVLDQASGLLLPGGGDVDPIQYGQPRHPRTRGISRERDRYEINLLREALKRDMPVLAICRGFQLLNVTMGGTLVQHLADEGERLDHDRDMPRAEPVHTLKIEPGCYLGEVFGKLEVPVNSHHHQGLDRVADGLDQVAWSGDGVLEAVIASGYSWVVGVQWHPEVMAPMASAQLRLFEEFVAASRSYTERTAAA